MKSSSSNKSKSKQTDKVSYHKKPLDMTTAEWQLALRKQFAETQQFPITNIGGHPVFSDFKVYNPLSKNTYKVAIRGGEMNFCNCMDFKTNLLGTCKHIEAILLKLNKSDLNRRMLQGKFEQNYTSIYLQYKENRTVKLRVGTDNREDFELWKKQYFTEDGIMLEAAFDDIEKLLREAKIINEEFRCYDDAMEYIIQVRAKKHREQILKKVLSSGEDLGEVDYFNTLIRAKLFPYQKEGIAFAVKAGRCLLADDMGLGKTIQAIGATEMMKKELKISKVLIVCPTSLKYQWKSEIEKFTDNAVMVIEGNALKREILHKSNSFYKITSYDAVRRDVKYINESEYDLVILDEAQRIKNWKTKVAQNVKKIKSTYAFVLTGTPLENKIEELYSLVQFVDSFKLGPLYHFLETHQIKNEVGKVTGYRELNKVGEILSDILLRRTKKEVLKQLPERMDKNLFVPMTEKQAEIHNENKDIVAKLVYKWQRMGFLNEKDRQRLMIAMNMMRMTCDSTFVIDQETRHDTKIEELMCILDSFFAGEEKAVIFSQWERMTRIVAMELEQRNIKFEYLHGGVPSKDRKALFENFNNDKDCRVFLSTDAGGVGLNLQAASLLVNMDIPWNPAVLEQRIARIHRLGQKRNVSIINLVSTGTIEHRMLDVLKFKSSLAEGILDNGEDSIFMNTDRFKEFMKSMETLTSEMGNAVAEEEEEITEDAEATVVSEKEQEKDIEVIQATALLTEDSSTTEQNISEPTPVAQNGQSATNTQESVSRLITSGIDFFSKLAKTFADKESTEKLVQSIVEKDTTGKTYLKIPVESEKIVENAITMLSGLLKGIMNK